MSNTTMAPQTETPSIQQQAVLDWVENGKGSLNLVARAGCGKTSTLMMVARKLKGKETVLLAYNKAIAEEIKQRLVREGFPSSVRAQTVHSLGYASWLRVAKETKLDSDKVRKIILGFSKNPEDFYARNVPNISKLVSLAKQCAFGFLVPTTERQAWFELDDHHGVSDDLADGDKVDALVDASTAVLEKSIAMDRETIDFDDMILAPLVHNAPVYYKDWILLDEAQDTNAARRALALKCLKPVTGRMVFVGDPCQPEGTLVTILKQKGNAWKKAQYEQVPIEKLKVGDRVTSYQLGDSTFISKGYLIKGITRRPYSGDLVVVNLKNGKKSRYTPAHKCLVNFTDLRNKYSVYVLRKGNQYRIGKCKMNYTGSSGIPARMRHENADAAWLLELFDTEIEAYYREQALGALFSIPQLMFNYKNLQRKNSVKYLALAWRSIGDNHNNGERLLQYFGRDPHYPLFEISSNKQKTIKRPIMTRACNLISGIRVLPFEEKTHASKFNWQSARISREHYSGTVISLTVDKSRLYVADSIVTSNCQAIYGFTGSDSNAMDLIKEQLNAHELKLSVTYRCPKVVVAEANKIVPDIVAHESAPEGLVRELPIFGQDNRPWFLTEPPDKTSAILCRNTKPLIEHAYLFLSNGIGCRVEGREIGEGLVNLACRWKSVQTTHQLIQKLDDYLLRETQKFMAKGKEDRAQAVEDKVGALKAVIKRVNSQGNHGISDVVASIRGLFGDTKPGETPKVVTLSTIHKSKGREWNTVYILDRANTLPSPYAKKEWQQHQEQNLEYVAVTRAKKELVDLVAPRNKKGG